MKNLRLGIIALILTTIAHSCSGQTSVRNKVTGLLPSQETIISTSPYMIISGDVINAKTKRVDIKLYVLDKETCEWDEIESFNSRKYNFLLERDQEYQIWFSDEDISKIMYIDPGYSGDLTYNIHVNFESNSCIRMTPG